MKPRVTEIIRVAFPESFRHFRSWDAELGKELHALLAGYDLGWPEGPPPRASSREKSCLTAYHAFRCGLPHLKLIECEQPREHRALGYRGTPDCVFHDGRGHIVLERKTGSSALWHKLQVAAYSLLDGVRPARRWRLYLKSNGAFRLLEDADAASIETWIELVGRHEPDYEKEQSCLK